MPWCPPVTCSRSSTPQTGETVAFSPDGHRHGLRQRRQHGAGCGTRPPANRSASRSPATPAGDSVAFSPDGTRSPPAATTTRCGCGTRPPANRSAPRSRPHRRGARRGVQPGRHPLASAGDDDTVRLWDAATGKPVGDPLSGHTDGVRSVAFSPDGTRSPPPATTPRCGCGTRPPANRSARRSGHTGAVTVWRSARTAPARLRRRRRHGAAVGRGHRATGRRAADRHTAR